MLARDGSGTIHHHNLQLLPVEMYKINNKLSPEFMHDIFTTRHIGGLNLRKQNNFQLHRPKTVSYGTS